MVRPTDHQSQGARFASAGNPAEHDRLVLAGLQELLEGDEAELVVLAQASMTAVAAQLPLGLQQRILSSPRSGILRAGEVLREAAHP